jgi:hypothetical protein
VAVLLKYGCGVRFGFCCYFSAALSLCSFAIIGDFLVGYVPLLALVFLPLQFPVVLLVIFTAATYPTTSLRRYVPLLALVFLPLQFPVVVLVIFTAATYPTTSLRRLALRALFFALFSPTLSLHHILADPFSEHGVALLNTEEGRVNG